MAPTQSRQIERITSKNRTRLLKPTIGLNRSDRGDKGKHDKKNKCHANPNNAYSTTYKIPMA